MSVTRTDYLIYGIELDFKSIDFEDFESEICGEPDRRFDMLYDGMSGDFVFAGKILAKSKDYEGFGITEINLDLIAQDSHFVNNVKKCFDKSDFRFFLVSYYT